MRQVLARSKRGQLRDQRRYAQARRRYTQARRRPMAMERLEDRRLLATITVTTLEDVVDENDGVISLREAVDQANQLAGRDEITFDTALTDGQVGLIRLAGSSIEITSELAINGPGRDQLVVNGDFKSRIFTIEDADFDSSFAVEIADISLIHGLADDGDPNVGLLDFGGAIYSSEDLSLHRVAVNENRAEREGGAIFVRAGSLQVFDSQIQFNQAEIAAGGAIFIPPPTETSSSDVLVADSVLSSNHSGLAGGAIVNYGSLTVLRSTLDGNDADHRGGAILNDGELTVVDSTLSNNRADQLGLPNVASFGGALAGSGVTEISGSTFSSNTADIGGALYVDGGSIGIVATTIAHNTATSLGGGVVVDFGVEQNLVINAIIASNAAPANPDIRGTIHAIHSLIGDAGNALIVGSDNVVGQDPLLNPLAYNGGPTKTHSLKSDSPAIDAGSVGFTTTTFDQRGDPFRRIFGGNVDIGSYERQLDLIVVNTIDDQLDFDDHLTSLRKAILTANDREGANEILFDPNLFADDVATLALSLGQMRITDDLRMITPVGRTLIIDAGHDSRIFLIDDGDIATMIEVEISGFNLIHGLADDGNDNERTEADHGGAIYSAESTTIKDTQVSMNHAGSLGGGIISSGPLRLHNTTVANNTSENDGGGIWNSDSLVIIQSTISSNTANHNGGGILNHLNASLSADRVTIARNSAANQGGGIHKLSISNVSAQNSIIAGNTAPDGPEVRGTIRSHHSLIQDTSGAFLDPLSTENLLDVQARLGPLNDNGGNHQTHALLPDSPAIDAGLDGLVERDALDLNDNGIQNDPYPFDQRGEAFPRITDGDQDGVATVDLGAVEFPGEVNHPPSLTVLGDQHVIEGAGPQVVSAFAAFDPGDPSESEQSVHQYWVIDVSEPDLFLDSPVIDAFGELTFTPKPDRAGQALVQVVVLDDGGGWNYSLPVSFSIVIDPATHDFGDAPSGYPVTLADDGARHRKSLLRLGQHIDAEGDGNPSSTAAGDGVDEDGVVSLADIVAVPGSATTSSFLVQATSAGLLDAWIDFDGDHQWNHTDERIAASIPLVAGANTISVSVPVTAVPGEVAARFRLSSAGDLLPTGAADDGEVEDYLVTILDGSNRVPASVNDPFEMTTIRVDHEQLTVHNADTPLLELPTETIGEVHLLGTWFNQSVTVDLPSGDLGSFGKIYLDGDRGDNTLRLVGQRRQFDLSSSDYVVPYQFATIDLVADLDPKVLTVNLASVSRLAPTTRQVIVTGGQGDEIVFSDSENWILDDPEFIDGRWYRNAVHAPAVTGQESILIGLLYPWQNPLRPSDVNNNGEITAADALVIINELARRSFSDQSTNALVDPGEVDLWPGFYFDQNGDDQATALDALRVINDLARAASRTVLPEPNAIDVDYQPHNSHDSDYRRSLLQQTRPDDGSRFQPNGSSKIFSASNASNPTDAVSMIPSEPTARSEANDDRDAITVELADPINDRLH